MIMKIRQWFNVAVLIGVMIMSMSCKEDKAPDVSLLKDEANPVVKIETSVGDIFVELYKKEAPVSVENFLAYVESGFYEGTIFHRVIKGFMIQGGGLTTDLDEKPNRDPIKNEAMNGLRNDKGTLAMARTAIVDSATSQFFINVSDNDFLNHKSSNPVEFGYAVFGKVIEGIDVVEHIETVPTHTRQPYDDVPQSDVVINRMVVVH